MLLSHAWETTPLGPSAVWSESLIAAVKLVMSCPLPAVLYWGPEMTMIYNDRCGETLGRRHPAAFGGTAAVVWKDLWPIFRARFERVLECGEPFTEERSPFRTMVEGRLVESFWTRMLTPFYEDGRVAGIFSIHQDVTQQVQAERARQTLDERVAVALSAAHSIGIWDWNLETDEVFVEERFADCWGIEIDPRGDGLLSADLLRRVHPEDVVATHQAVLAALETGADYAGRFRVVRRDGIVRWILARGSTLRNQAGERARFTGIAFDVTSEMLCEPSQAPGDSRRAANANPALSSLAGLRRISQLPPAGDDPRIEVPLDYGLERPPGRIAPAPPNLARVRMPLSVPRLVAALVKSIVAKKDEVRITTTGDCEATQICLSLAPCDRERLLQSGDRTLRSIRAVLAAASVKANHRYSLRLVGPDTGSEPRPPDGGPVTLRLQ